MNETKSEVKYFVKIHENLESNNPSSYTCSPWVLQEINMVISSRICQSLCNYT